MSDYLYSSSPQKEGELSNSITSIYLNSPPLVKEYHGDWGALAVSYSHYSGFQPFETEEHLMVVIGGPVFYFRDNDFLVQKDSSEATESIYHRWVIDDKMIWDEDLSGPFTIFLLNKKDKIVKVVTDLMSFIPIYVHKNSKELYLGTHIDALAKISNQSGNFDSVSLADFVINDVITYPYTAYKNISQISPSSETSFIEGNEVVKSYWLPQEINSFSNLNEASESLRCGLKSYVDRVTNKMEKVAQFISGGEDSRALSGLLDSNLERDAYVFLDKMNREGKIAEKVADKYEINFNVGYRKDTHYLDILPEASRLVGTGHQYHHAHSLGFDKTYKLAEYSAVFGGYLSDSLLKSAYALNYKKTNRYPFLPDLFKKGESRTKALENKLFDEYVLNKVSERRVAHFNKIKYLRPVSAHEWFVLYPATMRTAIPNLYTTRRLFKSYEPFMCKESVKISAEVPTSWKLNRRLFNKSMKPYLEKTKWTLHADGRLPYFTWWVNSPIQFPIWFYRHLAKRVGLIKGNQGPWGSWLQISQGAEWKKNISTYSKSFNGYNIFLNENENDMIEILSSQYINIPQKVNIFQLAFNLSDEN